MPIHEVYFIHGHIIINTESERTGKRRGRAFFRKQFVG